MTTQAYLKTDTQRFADKKRARKILRYASMALLGIGFATAAMAGTDTTFTPALTTFGGFLSGSGGKLIALAAMTIGAINMAGGRFTFAHIGIPVGVALTSFYGGPIVTGLVTATI